MRILLVTNYQPPHMGGIEFAGEALKACWVERGHEVTWLTTDLPRGALPAQAPGNIRVRSLNFFEERWQINSPLVLPTAWPLIRRLAREHDVVNPHSLAPGLSSLALIMAAQARRPVVATQHVDVIPLGNACLNHVQHFCLVSLCKWAARRGVKITFVGAAVRQWFMQHAQLTESQTAMTPAGINPHDYYYVDESERAALRSKWCLAPDRFHVLFVGRFYEKKGILLIRNLAEQYPQLQFTLVGSGVISTADWQHPNITFHKFVSTQELRELYGAHDLFIMPSVGEGWPAVVPQAMACGLYCLISEETFGGYRKDRERFLVLPRDVKIMGEAITQLATGERAAPARAETSAYAMSHWNWMDTAIIYEHLFEEARARQNAQAFKR